MKVILLIIVFIMSSYSARAQLYDQDKVPYIDDLEHFPEDYIQSNHISRKEIYTYNVKEDWRNDSLLLVTYIYGYDAFNKLVSRRKFAAGKLMAKDSCIYNSSGYTVMREDYTPENPDPKALKRPDRSKMTFDYKLDALGKELSVLEYNKDTTTLRLVQKAYNDSGKLINVKMQIDAYKPYFSHYLRYGPDGRIQETTRFKTNGVEMYSYYFVHKANITNVYLINPNGKSLNSQFEYDPVTRKCIILRGDISVHLQDDKELEVAEFTNRYVYNSDGTLHSLSVYDITGISKQLKFYYTH